MFKQGDLVRRIDGAGGGWPAWCGYCRRLKISPTQPVRVDLGYYNRLRLKSGEDFVGNSEHTHWSKEYFELAVEAKPLEDWM